MIVKLSPLSSPRLFHDYYSCNRCSFACRDGFSPYSSPSTITQGTTTNDLLQLTPRATAAHQNRFYCNGASPAIADLEDAIDTTDLDALVALLVYDSVFKFSKINSIYATPDSSIVGGREDPGCLINIPRSNPLIEFDIESAVNFMKTKAEVEPDFRSKPVGAILRGIGAGLLHSCVLEPVLAYDFMSCYDVTDHTFDNNN